MVFQGEWAGQGMRTPVAYNVLNAGFAIYMSTPDFSGTLATTSLAEVLRMLVQAKQTGILVLQIEEEEGAVSMENGMILNARAGTDSGMRALFQFVGWPDARFEFRQQTLGPDFKRDLAVYDPEVLITGVAAKMGPAPLAADA